MKQTALSFSVSKDEKCPCNSMKGCYYVSVEELSSNLIDSIEIDHFMLHHNEYNNENDVYEKVCNKYKEIVKGENVSL